MVSQPHVTTGSPGTDPDVLFDLLDYLREQGFKISSNEYAVVQDLMLALIALGKDVSDRGVIQSYLAPVVCTTAREQASFKAYVDRWYSRNTPSKAEQDPVVQNEIRKTASQWTKSRWIIASTALVISVATFWYTERGHRHAPLPPPSNNAAETVKDAAETVADSTYQHRYRLLLHGALFIALTLFASGTWWFFRARLLLQRRSSTDTPDITTISVGRDTSSIFDQVQVRRAAADLRRRYPVPSSELAIEGTIEQTIRNGGEFTPVYRTRLVAPDYLMLIDRRSFKDHNAQLVEEVVGRLRSNQVEIQRFYFDRDPRSVYSSEARERPIALNDVLGRNLESRILLFCDGEVFFDAVSSELETWTEALLDRPWIGIFTVKERETWGCRERILSEHAVVLPATIDSVVDFARSCNGVPVRRPQTGENYAIFPAELLDRPERWLERDSPDPALASEVLAAVHRFLGDDGYFWFGSCAAYPAVNFNLTLFLGHALKTASGQPLYSLARAAALFRLPWMREGYIPDWLRLRLLQELSTQQTGNIRQALNRLWVSAATGSSEALDFEIAQSSSNVLSVLSKALYRKLRRNAPPDSPVRDYVFASIMLGRDVRPLAVRIPRFWRDLLRRRKESKFKRGEAPELTKQPWKLRFAAAWSYISFPIFLITWAVIALTRQAWSPFVIGLFVLLWIGLPFLRPVRHSPFVLYHAFQGLCLWIFLLLLSLTVGLGIALDISGVIILFYVTLLVAPFLCLMGIVSTFRGNEIRLVLLGSLARRFAARWAIQSVSVPPDQIEHSIAGAFAA